MGILDTLSVLTTPTKVKVFSSLPEVQLLDSTKLQMFIDRAEFIASRLFDYDNTLPYYLQQMEYAIDMLVENLVVMNTPTFKRSSVARFRAEQIGTYSYSRDTGSVSIEGPSYLTEEAMMILKAFVIGNPYKYTTTMIFLPRTFSIDSTGERFYLPDNESIDRAFRDPPNPERLEPWGT